MVTEQIVRPICADIARQVSRQELAPYQPESSYGAPAPPVDDLNGRPGKIIKNQVKSTFLYLYF